MKRTLCLVAAALLSACASVSDDAPPAAKRMAAPAADIDAILAAQPESAQARYRYRHPKETLAFFGIEPGMRVVEALPGGGWYSRLLLPYLGADGELVGADYAMDMWPNFSFMTPERIEAKKTWVADWTEEAAGWRGEQDAGVSAFVFGEMPAALNGTADAVLFVRALHNLNRFEPDGGFLTEALADAYAALKPGGIVGVVQHEAPATASDEWASGASGYLKRDALLRQMAAAGFEFVAASDINANPLDQPVGDDIVWRLPPSLVTSRDDPALRERLQQIGESNRMTLKFRTPLSRRRGRADQGAPAEALLAKSSMFKGKSILITGGTGSFGRKCAETLLTHHSPGRLVVFSRDELKQFEMQQVCTDPCMRYLLGDVRDRDRLRQAMHDVDYVIHAAALKQVRAAEYNPTECINTNIHGAENVIHAALEAGVRKVIALSTDKAANPVSLYGATKLASDKLFVAANNVAGASGTAFSVVRYGNFVGSRGSVVPFFARLLRENADSLPLTDPRMTRFWIVPQQGVDFVLRSFERMVGGELFVPKTPSMRVVDLARAMAPNVPTHTIGIRPGEKLHEVMCPRDDAPLTLEFDDHFVICPSIRFDHGDIDYTQNAIGERGRPVAADFEYDSSTNPHFLTVEELAELNDAALE